MARMTAVAAVLLGTVSVTACESRDFDTTETPMASETEQARSDAEISIAVQAKYYTDDIARGRPIDVSTNSGVVTLRGTVENEAAREHAVNLARDVAGVTQVNDELLVAGDGTADAPATSARQENDGHAARSITDRVADATQPIFVTTTIQAKYFLEPGLKPSRINVTTSADGVVTLEGAVQSEAARNEAVRIAQDTEGVTEVEDRLRVQAPEDVRAGDSVDAAEGPFADAWVTMKIQSQYFLDGDVRARNIEVTTDDGHVTLNGVVGSEAERRQAVALARNTDGVREVTDRLTVDAQIDERAGGDARAMDDTDDGIERLDSWITMKIQAKYFLDTDVKGSDIDVDTSDGVVTLSGTVSSADQKLEAEQIARETDGVNRVVNELMLSAGGAQQ